MTHFVTTAAIAGVAGSAFAFVPWTNDSGSTTNWDWSNGGSDNGLFGDPVVNDGGFTFFPNNFRAESVAGAPAIVADRLEFTLEANNNFFFEEIRIREFGDYGVFDPAGEVSVSGSVFVTNLDVFEVFIDDLETTPGSPITSGSGNWTGEAAPDLSGSTFPLTRITVVVDNNLIALSSNGTTFIEKKVVGAAVQIEIVPAPAGLAILALGGVCIRRRR